MSKISTFIKLLKNDRKRIYGAFILNLSKTSFSHLISDKHFLKMQYKAAFGKKLNLNNPATYNEKLQWLKLYDRNPNYTKMVDKYEVKEHVANLIGEEYIIPTIGVWDNFDDIDFDKLPEKFVLKCTHDSGGIAICTDKSTFDIEEAKKLLVPRLKYNMFWHGREWPYKNVKPRFIVEAYMEDSNTKELRDYKYFCFNGEPKAIFIAADRQNKEKETTFDFFDIEGKHMAVRNGHPNAENPPALPGNFEKMKELASKLSKDIPHVRVDFYEVDGKIYFGELTFFHYSGMVPFEPGEWDYTFGSWIRLPEKK